MVTSVQPPITAQPAVATEKTKDRSALSRMLEKSRDEQYNVFMKMFLAQVKNQNPDNPMSTHEMTQSVMSFFSAAEQAQTNKLLKHGNDMKVKEQMAAAKTYLNKEIVYEDDRLVFNGQPEDISLIMPGGVVEAELVVLDQQLNRVKTFPLDPSKIGKQTFSWDGLNDNEMPAGHGIYHTKVLAVDSKKQIVEIPTAFKGRVQQIAYQDDSGDFLLLVNDSVGVGLDDVLSVSKPASQDIIGLTKTMQEQIKQYEELNKLIKSQIPPEPTSTPIPDYYS